MADDVQLNSVSGSAGDIIAADEIAGVKHQRMKVQFGDDGAATDASRTAPFPTALGNVESTANTTTTTLGSGATYTGTGEVAPADGVTVSCFSDTAGTLYFDFSVNGTDWRTFPTSGFTVSASIHEYHTAKVNGRYFRARFVNSASVQSTFQLYTYFGPHTQPNAPLNQSLGLDADSILVRPTFPWLDTARGLVSGMAEVKKFGRNEAAGTSFEPCCIGGVYQTPQSGSATALRVAAGNVNDTAAGTGAREITLIGLDENFAEATETVATAGASASSATTTTFTRLYRAYVSASGTYATSSAGSHSADIVIENSAGGTTWATIDATDFPKAQSEIGAYSVATGKSAYVFLTDLTIDTTKTTDFVFFYRGGIDETSAPYSAMRTQAAIIGVKANQQLAGRQAPLGPFTGPCDIGFMAKVDSGTAQTAVEFEIFVVDE